MSSLRFLNNQKKNSYVLLIGMILMSACKMKTKKLEVVHSQPVTISIDLTNTAKKFTDSIISDIRFIGISQSDEKGLLSGVDKVIIIKNKIYILDKSFKALKCFDTSGKYLNSVGKLGVRLNQGEFSSLMDFTYNPLTNTLLLMCNDNLGTILEFDLDGTFITKHPLRFYAHQYAVKRTLNIFFTNYNFASQVENSNLVLADKELNIIATGFKVAEGGYSVSSSGGLYSTNGKIYFNPPLHNTIYLVDSNNVLRAYYNINFGKDSVPNKKLDRLSKLFEGGEIFNYSYLNNSFAETENTVSFTSTIDRIMKIAFLNKKTRSIVIPSSDIPTPFNHISDVWESEGKFVSLFSPIALPYLRDKVMPIINDQRYEQLKRILNKNKEEDIFILAIYNVKDF